MQESRVYQYLVLGYIAFVLLFPKISLIKISNFATPVRIEDFLLLILILFGFVLFRRDEDFRKKILGALFSPVSILIIGWLSLMFISTTHNVVFNQLSVSSYLFVLRFVEYAALFYLGYAAAPTKKSRSVCFNVLIALGILISAWALLQITGAAGGYGGGFYQYTYIKGTDRAFASFSGPYELAGFLIVLIPIAAGIFVITKNRRLKLFYFAALVAAIMTMGFSGARFPVICSFLAVLSLSLARRELKHKLTVGALALMTLIMPLFVSKPLVMRFQLLAGTFESFREEEMARQILQEKELQEEAREPSFPITAVEEKEEEGVPEETFNLAGNIKKRVSVFVDEVNERRRAFVKGIEERGSLLLEKVKEADPSLRWRLSETWPRALAKVRKNPLLGGGMGSVGIGLDGEYATLLGETGILGLAVFIALLRKIMAEMLKKVRRLEDHQSRVLAFAIISVTIGLAANAVFADIFRASKIAFLFWYLVGTSLGVKEEV